jgi:hypothetical protein
MAYPRIYTISTRVPQRWAEDPALGRWVKKLRGLKKKLDGGELQSSAMKERASKLDALGFFL